MLSAAQHCVAVTTPSLNETIHDAIARFPASPDLACGTAIQAGTVGILGLGMNHHTALRAAHVKSANTVRRESKIGNLRVPVRRPDSARQL